MIPQFNHEGLIPPFLGDMARGDAFSPYTTNIWEFVDRFSTSKRRCKILQGLIDLRHKLFCGGVLGFQWIGGSFTQRLSDREPSDIDIVTFFDYISSIDDMSRHIIDNKLHKNFGSKAAYMCDSFIVDISKNNIASNIIQQSTYWNGLFSHTRDKIWKGMLEIELQTEPYETDFLKSFLSVKECLV